MDDYQGLLSPVAYYGGKDWFIPLLPQYTPRHTTYVETCGGSGKVLLAKPPSPIEIFNDKDEAVFNFFQVLRDPIKSRRLKELLELTPYNRQQWRLCKEKYREYPDDVQRAWGWFVAIRQGRDALPNGSWARETSPYKRPLSHNVRKWLAGIDRIIPELCARLRLVQIENQSVLELVPAVDSPETWFVVDTPYVWSTRGQTRYPVDMDDSEQVALVSLLLEVKGMVLLFGRPNPIYQPLEQMGWLRKDEPRTNYSVHLPKPPEDGSRGKRPVQTESIWLSPNLMEALGKAPPKIVEELDLPLISLTPSSSKIVFILQYKAQDIAGRDQLESVGCLAAYFWCSISSSEGPYEKFNSLSRIETEQQTRYQGK